jgi:hypothetical protein
MYIYVYILCIYIIYVCIINIYMCVYVCMYMGGFVCERGRYYLKLQYNGARGGGGWIILYVDVSVGVWVYVYVCMYNM